MEPLSFGIGMFMGCLAGAMIVALFGLRDRE